MMSLDPKIDKKLSEKLSSYEVNVPDFPMKQNRLDRFITLLATPAKNPLDHWAKSMRGITLLGSVPLISALLLSMVQIIVFF